MKLGLLAALTTTMIVSTSGAALSSDGLSLRGFGTAAVDGTLSPGEWDAAGRYEFSAARAAADGGGTVPATLFVMNDSAHVYLALRVAVVNLGFSAFSTVFHAPGANGFAEGSDILRTSPTSFEDLHYHLVPPDTYPWLADVDDGGTRDGAGIVRVHDGYSVFEVAHPLDSADDRHDLALTFGKRLPFYAAFHHCVEACAATSMPSSGFGEVVAVSGSREAPDTRLTRGPRDGAEVRDERTFEFTGSDDAVSPPDLTYECKVDAEDWTGCESPVGGVVQDGWHTLRVRAVDDMLLVDATPAKRRWRLDSRAPSRPTVAGPRVSRTSSPVYRFSARDSGTPRSRIRFRCAVDSRRLHACNATYRRLLPTGRHVLRVQALDPAGNASPITRVRVAVLPPD